MKAALAIFAFVAFMLAHAWYFPAGALISKAEARVGRPLTPFSYAGVARRTYRRGAYGAYGGGYYGGGYHGPYRPYYNYPGNVYGPPY